MKRGHHTDRMTDRQTLQIYERIGLRADSLKRNPGKAFKALVKLFWQNVQIKKRSNKSYKKAFK